MGQLLTFTGISGSGKSALARAFLAETTTTYRVPSYTTRKRLPRDDEGEYEYIEQQEFGARIEEFLWQKTHAGNSYGTRRDDLRAVLHTKDAIGVMILVPDVLRDLQTYIRRYRERTRRRTVRLWTPVFVRPPSLGEAARRMLARGDAPEEIAKRHASEADWEERALALDIDFMFITTDATIEEEVEQIRAVANHGVAF